MRRSRGGLSKIKDILVSLEESGADGVKLIAGAEPFGPEAGLGFGFAAFYKYSRQYIQKYVRAEQIPDFAPSSFSDEQYYL